MKVVCIDNKHIGSEHSTRLTKGRVYDVISHCHMGYNLINDEGDLETFVEYRFETLSKKRDDKLKSIGI